MSSSGQNIRNTFNNNPRARMVLFFMAFVILAMMVFGIMSMFRKPAATAQDTASLPSAPNLEAAPGGSVDPEYNRLQQAENLRRQEEAATRGESTLPVLVGPTDDAAVNPLDGDIRGPVVPDLPEVPPPVEDEVDAPVVSVPAVEAPVPVAPEPIVVAPPPPPPPSPIVVQPTYDVAAYEARRAARQANVEQQLTGIMQAWGAVPGMSVERVGGVGVVDAASAGAGQIANGAGQAAQGLSQGAGQVVDGGMRSAASQPSYVRAGTVIPAVLLSSLNSDMPGPVIAQITSGPFRGARLIGSFQAGKSSMAVTFNQMVSPSFGTLGINAVAVDSKYSVGMASKVNNHYFLRYSTLLASAFVRGYGQAVGRTGTTTVVGPFGTTTTQNELSTDQIRNVAYGEVGNAIGQELAKRAEHAPTVYLDCRGGCSVGVLFVSDL